MFDEAGAPHEHRGRARRRWWSAATGVVGDEGGAEFGREQGEGGRDVGVHTPGTRSVGEDLEDYSAVTRLRVVELQERGLGPQQVSRRALPLVSFHHRRPSTCGEHRPAPGILVHTALHRQNGPGTQGVGLCPVGPHVEATAAAVSYPD